jgi:hypothetical protein
MDITKIILATLLMILGQIGSFMQLQGSIKYGWAEKYFNFEIHNCCRTSILEIK